MLVDGGAWRFRVGARAMKIRRVQDDFPGGFVDPVTGLKPGSEREVTALLWLRHQARAVDWSRVTLYKLDPTDGNSLIDSGLRANSLFKPGSLLCYEYPLMSANRRDGNTWGAMLADLMLLDQEGCPSAILECKLDANFTGGGTCRKTGQLARLASYLAKAVERAPGAKSNLVLVCPKPRGKWRSNSRYLTALKNAIPTGQCTKFRVSRYVIYWGEIANALGASEVRMRRRGKSKSSGRAR